MNKIIMLILAIIASGLMYVCVQHYMKKSDEVVIQCLFNSDCPGSSWCHWGKCT